MAAYLFITFAVTALLGFPIWVVLAASCFVAISAGSATPMLVIAQRMFTSVDSFPLLAIPLFMVAGSLMEGGGISRRLINFCNALLGSFTGGLAMVAILTCMLFAAISGSGPATVAAIGGIMIPEMVKAGYSKPFAAALMSVAGAIGVIIPPSLPMVNYGIAGSVSISTLFAAGFGPGILVGVALMIVAYFSSKKNGYGLAAKQSFSWKNVAVSFKEAFFALLMPFIVLGGIYGGICSPTEAATISIFYSLIVSLFIYRTIKIRDLPKIMLEGIHSYAPILIILSAAVAFARVITLMNVATIVSEAVLSAISSKVVILLLINVLLLFVGMIMDTGPAILVFTPVLLPVAEAIGVDPIHFGIIMCVNLAIGFVTPPMGANLFVASNLSKVSVFDIARKAVPFILAFLIALLLITFVPQISMFLLQ